MNRTATIIVWSVLSLGTFGCGGGGSAPTSPSSTSTSTTTTTTTPTTPATTPVTWNFNGSAWAASGTAPACPSPLNLSLPVDLSRVTSILYPGQTRGEYKPHGGFRFDQPGQANDVAVTVPMASTIFRGARYLVGGEIQYEFDFISECGLMHRIGHLRELSARFAALAATLPAAVEGDSRTTNFPAGLTDTAGEGLGTAVGLRTTNNVFFDWGVYDLRQRNSASANATWFAAHPGELAPYAICWLDVLSSANSAAVRALPPADATAGRTSDLCR